MVLAGTTRYRLEDMWSLDRGTRRRRVGACDPGTGHAYLVTPADPRFRNKAPI